MKLSINRKFRWPRLRWLFIWLVSCSTVCSKLAYSQSVNSDTAAAEDAESLAAGVQQWLQEVSFCCTYRISSGHVRTVDDALAGRLTDPQTYCTGVLRKRGADVRASVDYVGGARDISDAQGKTVLIKVAHDEMTTATIELNYQPPQSGALEGATGFINLGRKRSAFTDRMIPGLSTYGQCGPLLLCAARDGSPLSMSKLVPVGVKPNVVVNRAQNELVEVSLKFSGEMGTETRSVTFKTDGPLPVVEKVVVNQDLPSGERVAFYTQAFEFVRCGDQIVPSVVRCITTSGESRWTAFEWNAEDLGRRECTDGDFVYEVPETVKIHGLKVPPPAKDGVRRIAVSSLTADDLGEAPSRAPLAAPAQPGGGTRLKWLLLVANATVLLAFLAYRWYRRRARTS